ncbi:hypothetical protein Hanom_Chr01g00062871 [Helianthus anomalus]
MAFLVLSLCSHDLVISRHFLKQIILGSRSHQVCFSYFCILDRIALGTRSHQECFLYSYIATHLVLVLTKCASYYHTIC